MIKKLMLKPVLNESGTNTLNYYEVYIETELQLGSIYEVIVNQYEISSTIKLLKMELEQHVKRRPQRNDKLKLWKEKFDTLLQDLTKFTLYESIGIRSFPLVFDEDNNVIGFKEGCEVKIEYRE